MLARITGPAITLRKFVNRVEASYGLASTTSLLLVGKTLHVESARGQEILDLAGDMPRLQVEVRKP